MWPLTFTLSHGGAVGGGVLGVRVVQRLECGVHGGLVDARLGLRPGVGLAGLGFVGELHTLRGGGL